MTDEMKFCKDCRWFETESLSEGLSSPGQPISAECGHKDALAPTLDDVVWGVQKPIKMDAYGARSVNGPCGPDALLFEEKTK